MTQQMKIKILLYALIFLGALNVATIGTIVWHVNQEKKNIPAQTTYNDTTASQNRNSARPATTFRRGRSLPFRKIVRELDLTEEQYTRFVAEHQKFLAKVRPLIADLHLYREKIDQELAKPNPSMAKIRRYSRRIGKIHEKLSIVQSEYYIALAKLCTPEQRQKLYEIYRKSQVSPGWRRWKNK